MSDECRWSRCARYETPALYACVLTIFPCCLPQPSDLIHATHKEFHWAKNGKTYALGHAAKYASYMEKNHPTATNMRSRGQKGSRHDQVFEAALAIFIDRPGQVSFMEEECDGASLLVSACYINLSSLAMIALARALGVLFLVLSSRGASSLAPTRSASTANAGTMTMTTIWILLFRSTMMAMAMRVVHPQGPGVP